MTTAMANTKTLDTVSMLAKAEEEDRDHVHYISGGYHQSRPVLRGAQAKKPFDCIPIVDVSTISSPDPDLRQAVARDVAKAAEEVGFFLCS